MWHSDPAWLHRMLELLVVPNMRNLIPAVLLQALYDFSAGHRHDTHFLHTCQVGIYRISAAILDRVLERGRFIYLDGRLGERVIST